MYQKNDYLMFKKEVCKVLEIKKNYHNHLDYYLLAPLSDESLKTLVPVNSEYIRNLLTKTEIEDLLKKIPSIPYITSDIRLMENEYKKCLSSNTHEDLIRIIKTAYLRNKERKEHHKRMGDKDQYYFERAENYLYREIAVVLNKSQEEAKAYVIAKVSQYHN